VGSFRTVIVHTRAFGVALGLVLLVAASIGAASVQAAARHVTYGKPGKVETPKVQGSHSNSADKPLVVVQKHKLWRSPAKAGVGKRQKVCNQMQIWTQVGSPPSSWKPYKTSPNYCTWFKPNQLGQMGEWRWVGEVATPYHVEFVVTWATQKRKLAKATYDYNVASDYQCLSLFCLVDTDPATNFPYISFN
jgi:hypothetical protein